MILFISLVVLLIVLGLLVLFLSYSHKRKERKLALIKQNIRKQKEAKEFESLNNQIRTNEIKQDVTEKYERIDMGNGHVMSIPRYTPRYNTVIQNVTGDIYSRSKDIIEKFTPSTDPADHEFILKLFGKG